MSRLDMMIRLPPQQRTVAATAALPTGDCDPAVDGIGVFDVLSGFVGPTTAHSFDVDQLALTTGVVAGELIGELCDGTVVTWSLSDGDVDLVSNRYSWHFPVSQVFAGWSATLTATVDGQAYTLTLTATGS